MIPICPHCGKTASTYVNARIWGWVKIPYNSKGEESTWDYAQTRYRESHLLRCSWCDHIRRDIRHFFNEKGETRFFIPMLTKDANGNSA